MGVLSLPADRYSGEPRRSTEMQHPTNQSMTGNGDDGEDEKDQSDPLIRPRKGTPFEEQHHHQWRGNEQWHLPSGERVQLPPRATVGPPTRPRTISPHGADYARPESRSPIQTMGEAGPKQQPGEPPRFLQSPPSAIPGAPFDQSRTQGSPPNRSQRKTMLPAHCSFPQ